MIYTFNAGDGGLATDLDGKDAAENLWTAGQNVRFDNGYFQPFSGHSRLYDPPTVTPYGVFPLRTANQNVWVYTGLTKMYTVSSSGTHTNITRAAGDYTATADTKWTGGEFSGIMVLNNENDAAQYWAGNPATPAILLTGWTSTWRAKALRPLRNYLVAVGITKGSTSYPVMVKWSHAANPGALPSSWDETDPTVDAGEQDLADANGYLVDMVPLGDLGILYTTGSYHAMQYIGGTYIWRFTRLSEFAGAMSQNCAIQYPGGHVVLTSGDVITHSGGAPQSIINSRMRATLFNSLNTTNFNRSFVCHDELKSEIWVCIPTTTSQCDTAYVWNYANNTWGIRDLPALTHANSGPLSVTASNTWADGTATWEEGSETWDTTSADPSKRRLVMASTNTRLYLADDGADYDGTSASMMVERTGLSFGDHNRIKFAKGVRLQVDGTLGTVLGVRLGGSANPDGPYTWTASTPFTVGTSRGAFMRISGKYIGLRIEDNVGQPWRCRSADIDFEWAGAR